MFFDSWSGILRVLVVGTLAYVSLVTMLRISGKRTLAKMNAFDLIVTVALGSTLATVLLTNSVALVEGLVALALLIGLQYVVAWASVRSRMAGNFVKSQPRLLYFRGTVLEEAMRAERITEGELAAAVREQGFGSLADVEAVVLETAGEMSVIGTVTPESAPDLDSLRR